MIIMRLKVWIMSLHSLICAWALSVLAARAHAGCGGVASVEACVRVRACLAQDAHALTLRAHHHSSWVLHRHGRLKV